MSDNMKKARQAQKRAGPAPRTLTLGLLNLETTVDEVLFKDSLDDEILTRIGLEKAMALRNLLSTWGNEKRNRDKRKEKL